DMFNALKGADGADGKSALELAIEANLLPAGATLTDLMAYLKGADGIDGIDGADGTDGKSALELAREIGLIGPEGTITDMFNALKGADGADGKSALELAIEANLLPA
ncbi:hypothetical protein, partial [Acinetobacter indicus]|uniref:hypothetical protein n=1 Tax=Acinetobacter indicus TaxID=756892 RepID=UPI001BB46E5B